MAERMVQVPESLIEYTTVILERHGYTAMLDRYRALLARPTAEPKRLRIEDLAPGTTFTAKMIGSSVEHRLVTPDFGVQYPTFGQDLWIHRRDIDPSTIRDVTPPKDAA